MSETRGVGSEEKDSLSSVDRADVRGGDEQRRSPLETQRSKGVEKRFGVVEERRDVLEEHHRRLALTDDSNELGPERSLVVVPASLPGEAVRLARQAGDDEIDSAAPLSPFERAEVVPHGRVVEHSASHVSDEALDRERVALDVTDRASRSKALESKVDSADTGTQAEGT